MVLKQKVVASIEARMTSSRLPGKVLKPLRDQTVLEFMIHRVKQAKLIDEVIVATTTNLSDDPIVSLCEQLHVPVFRGSEENVFERVWQAQKSLQSDVVCELTGDCPFIDPMVIDYALHYFMNGSFDYVSNCHDVGKTDFYRAEYPKGMDVEIFSFESFSKIRNTDLSKDDQEHVSLRYLQDGRFKTGRVDCPQKWCFTDLAVTLDEEADYQLLQSIANHFECADFSLEDLIAYIKEHESVLDLVKQVKRKLL